jgi:hypothetical protein
MVRHLAESGTHIKGVLAPHVHNALSAMRFAAGLAHLL